VNIRLFVWSIRHAVGLPLVCLSVPAAGSQTEGIKSVGEREGVRGKGREAGKGTIRFAVGRQVTRGRTATRQPERDVTEKREQAYDCQCH